MTSHSGSGAVTCSPVGAPSLLRAGPCAWPPGDRWGCEGGWGGIAPSALQLGFRGSWRPPTPTPPDISGLLPPSWGSVHSSVCPSIHPGSPLRAWLGLVVPLWQLRARRQSRGEGTSGPEDIRSRAAVPQGLGPPTPVLVCATVALCGGGRGLPSFRPVPGEPQPAHPVLSPEYCALGSQPASQERPKGRWRSNGGPARHQPGCRAPGLLAFPSRPVPYRRGQLGTRRSVCLPAPCRSRAAPALGSPLPLAESSKV